MLALIIILVNFIVYFRSLKLGYVSDDLRTAAKPLEQQKKETGMWYYIMRVTTNKPVEHLKSMLIHTGTCVFMYYALGANDISFAAALLFSVNPVNNQGAVWISGKGYALCSLFMMLSLSFPLLAPGFMYLATVSPGAYFFPIGFLGTEHWWIALFLLPVWVIRFKRLKKEVKHRRDFEAVDYDKKMSFNKIIVAIKTYGYYFTLCLIPFRVAFYHSFMQSGAGGGNDVMNKKAFKKDWTFYVGLSVLAFLIYSLWNWTPIAWGIFWFTVCIAPYLNLFRMQQEFSERYGYAACIGIMYALANIIPPMAVACLFGFYAARMIFYYTKAYADDYWLVETSVSEDPGAWYGWLMRAVKRMGQKAYREALNMFVMAKLISPQEFKVLYNIAIILKFFQQEQEAEEYFTLAEKYIIKGQEKSSEHLLRIGRQGKGTIIK